MGNLGRYLRRLSSPRIRFLRKSRQSKPDPTRLFHNLLVAKLGGGPLERFALERRKEGNAFRLNSFVRTSQTQRPRNAGSSVRGGGGGGGGRQASDISRGEVSIRLDTEGRTIAGEFLIRRASGEGSRCWAHVVNQRGCAGKLASNLPITDIVGELMAVSPPQPFVRSRWLIGN